MMLKRRTMVGLVVGPRNGKENLGTPITQNAYPLVLGGRQMKQLELPREFLTMPRKQRQAGTVVTPSNLAQVRATLKARKQNLG